MFHQNPQHTGLSPFLGPAVPFLTWKFQTSGRVDSPPAVGHGRIYLTSEDGNVYALNPQGVLQWKFRTGGPLRTTPAIGSDGTVYVGGCGPCGSTSGSPAGVLYAINPGGQLKWLATIANTGEGIDRLSSPTIGADGTIYVSDVGFRVIAISPGGAIKWQVSTGGEVVDPPSIAHDGTVYVGVDDPTPSGACGQCLAALNPDGTFKWGALPHAVGFSSPSVGADGTIYIAGYAVNPDGTVKWANPGTFSSPSIGPDGIIYGSVGADGDGVYAIKPNGTVQWTFPAKTTGVTIGSDATIYFGSSGILYALTPNGAVKWSFTVGFTGCPPDLVTLISACDPVIGSNGTIYMGSADGNLYAIGQQNGPVTPITYQ